LRDNKYISELCLKKLDIAVDFVNGQVVLFWLFIPLTKINGNIE